MIEALRKVIKRMHDPLSLRHIEEMMTDTACASTTRASQPQELFRQRVSIRWFLSLTLRPDARVQDYVQSDDQFETNIWEGSS